MQGLEVDQLCKDGVFRYLDISREATLKFGFVFQDRVDTPLGPATVLGVNGNRLYFLVDSDTAASYWSDCTTAEHFRAKGIVVRHESLPGGSSLQHTQGNTAVPSDYHSLKKIVFCGKERWIVMQSVNGPCPVIALANALILRGDLREYVPSGSSAIRADHLRGQLKAFMSTSRPCPVFQCPDVRPNSTDVKSLAGLCHESLEALRTKLICGPQSDALLRRFYGGLDVSPLFSHVDGFEAQEEATLFALAGVRLVHGWIFEEGGPFDLLRNLSFDEVGVAVFDTDKQPEVAQLALTVLSSQQQLTAPGLRTLHEAIAEGEVCVLFWNNHFSTVTKLNGNILCLASDVSFVDRSCLVFEVLADNMGSGDFTDGEGNPIDPVLLAVQSRLGDEFCEEDIMLARCQLTSISLTEPSAEEVIHFLKDAKKNQQALATASESKSSTALTIVPTNVPSTAPSSTTAVSAPSASPSEKSGASQLVQMGFCVNESDGLQLMKLHQTVERAINALIGA